MIMYYNIVSVNKGQGTDNTYYNVAGNKAGDGIYSDVRQDGERFTVQE